jgi:hypothetical protein
VAIQTSSNISNTVLTSSRVQELFGIDNSATYVIICMFLIITGLLFVIAEPEKISFFFYLRITCILFINSALIFDNLRLIWVNGNIWGNFCSTLWGKPQNIAKSYAVFISMLAYVYEMADCYLSSNLKKIKI